MTGNAGLLASFAIAALIAFNIVFPLRLRLLRDMQNIVPLIDKPGAIESRRAMLALFYNIQSQACGIALLYNFALSQSLSA